MADIHVFGAAILNESGKLLIVRRSSHEDQYPNYWELPGGRAETGETPEQTLIREVREETGLSVTRICGEYFRFSYRNVKECHYRVMADADCIILNPDEHSEFKWIERFDDLDGLLVTPELRCSIQAALSLCL